ncbi:MULTISPECIES: hypothetical protein [unclassified Pseudomonas]|uniref:hypothetical protein n=1 Tax=unclassified Pseudomonas TaxID=196821 RepID=UPI0011139AFC|nr:MULTISPECIES: hypothetical protein [unclassified Pseudomonas]
MNKYLISFVSCLLVGAFGLSVNAAGYIDLGHATGEQCKTESVTNNGIAVGNCSPASTSANNVPFVANVNTPNSKARLEPLDPH